MRRRDVAQRSSALRVGRGTSIRNLHRRPARIFLASHDCEMAGYAKKKTSASMKFLSCRVPFIKSRNSDGKHLQFCHCRATRPLYHYTTTLLLLLCPYANQPSCGMVNMARHTGIVLTFVNSVATVPLCFIVPHWEYSSQVQVFNFLLPICGAKSCWMWAKSQPKGYSHPSF